jgi:hypothetical protein
MQMIKAHLKCELVAFAADCTVDSDAKPVGVRGRVRVANKLKLWIGVRAYLVAFMET